MAVFHIHVGTDNGHVGKIAPGGNIDFPDFHWRAQAFIRFLNKLVDDAVFKEKYRNGCAQEHRSQGNDEPQKYLLSELQSGIRLGKVTATKFKPNKIKGNRPR